MRRIIAFGLGPAVLALSALASHADEWPSRPVRIVVPFARAAPQILSAGSMPTTR